jgi:hypothetical protein
LPFWPDPITLPATPVDYNAQPATPAYKNIQIATTADSNIVQVARLILNLSQAVSQFESCPVLFDEIPPPFYQDIHEAANKEADFNRMLLALKQCMIL